MNHLWAWINQGGLRKFIVTCKFEFFKMNFSICSCSGVMTRASSSVATRIHGRNPTCPTYASLPSTIRCWILRIRAKKWRGVDPSDRSIPACRSPSSRTRWDRCVFRAELSTPDIVITTTITITEGVPAMTSDSITRKVNSVC